MDLLVHYLAWLGVNLAIPFLLPLALVKLIQHGGFQLTDGQRERLRLTYMLKDAQLCLAGTGIAAVAIYEYLSAEHVKTPRLAGLLVAFLIALLGVNAIYFVWGTIIGTPPVNKVITKDTAFAEWRLLYPLAWLSMVFSIATGICAFAMHVVVFSSDHLATTTSTNVQSAPGSAPSQPSSKS